MLTPFFEHQVATYYLTETYVSPWILVKIFSVAKKSFPSQNGLHAEPYSLLMEDLALFHPSLHFYFDSWYGWLRGPQYLALFPDTSWRPILMTGSQGYALKYWNLVQI